MKIAILVRGFHFLQQDRFGYPLDARSLLPNLLDQVIEPLRREHDVVVFTATYPSAIETEVHAMLQPDRRLLLKPESSKQVSTYCRGLQEILADAAGPFDRVLVTRFDLQYLQPITAWKIWDRRGVHFPWREYEEYWIAHHRVGDAIHVVDGEWLAPFAAGLEELGDHNSLHQLYDVLADRGLPLHFVEPGFYDSNTLFAEPECTNPLYRIGNRPKLLGVRSSAASRLRVLKPLLPNRLWAWLAHPRTQPLTKRQAG